MRELTDPGDVGLHLSQLTPLKHFRSSHHEIAVYLHKHLGRVLTLNGEIQHVEAWAPLYHEPLIHLAAAFVPEPASALILGGASFFAAQEVLKYQSVKRVLVLDQDKDLIMSLATVYDHVAMLLSDQRIELRTTEAFSELASLNETFDLVVNDAVDLSRFQGDVLQLLVRSQTERGVCSDVVYRHIFDSEARHAALMRLSSVERLVMSLIVVPEYPGVLHLLTMWGKNKALHQGCRQVINDEQKVWLAKPETNPCRYYDPRFLHYYLHIPREIGDLVNARGKHV